MQYIDQPPAIQLESDNSSSVAVLLLLPWFIRYIVLSLLDTMLLGTISVFHELVNDAMFRYP
jgi:hypothetical protein